MNTIGGFRACWLVLCMLFPTLLAGQNYHVIDSLKQRLGEVEGVDERTEVLARIARAFQPQWDSVVHYGELACRVAADPASDPLWRFRAGYFTMNGYSYQGNPERIIEIGEELLPLVEVEPDTMARVDFLNLLGAFGYFPEGQTLRQLEVQIQALEVLMNSPKRLRAAAMLVKNIQQGYMVIGKPWKSEFWLEKVFQLAEANQDTAALIQLYLTRGLSSYYSDKKSDWLDQYQSALRLGLAFSQPGHLSDPLEKMGQAYLEIEECDSAILYFNQALELILPRNDAYQITFLEFLLGKAQICAGKYEVALETLLKAQQAYRDAGHAAKVIDVSIQLGKIYAELGQRDKAISHLEQVIDSCRAINYSAGVSRAMVFLASAHEKFGEWEKVAAYKDSLIIDAQKKYRSREEEMLSLARMEDDYQNTLLHSARLELRNLELEAQSNTRTYLFIGAFLLAIMGLCFGIVLRRNWKRQEKLARQLDQKVASQTLHLEESLEHIRHIQDDLRHFTFLASHNFKTAIRTVKSSADLLARKNLDPLSVKMLSYIQHAGKEMNATLDGLTEYWSLRDSDLARSPVDLRDIIDRQKAHLVTRFPEVAITWEIGDLPVIQASPGEMQMLFHHLLDNAIRYSQEGQATIRVHAARTSASHQITITDDGIGIQPEYLEQIMEPFSRLHTSDEIEGVGIGLAIARRIMIRHEGCIELQSETGQGTTVSLTFPVL